MLIVEGPDGSGKTTFVRRLQQEFPDFEVMPRVVAKDTRAMVDLVEWVEQDLDKGFGRRIYDRHRLISEPIYGPLIRGTMEPGFDSLPWLHAMQYSLWSIKPVVIWCLPPLETVLENVKKEYQPQEVIDRTPVIYWLYHNACASWAHPCWVWDYTRPDFFEAVFRQIRRRFDER